MNVVINELFPTTTFDTNNIDKFVIDKVVAIIFELFDCFFGAFFDYFTIPMKKQISQYDGKK